MYSSQAFEIDGMHRVDPEAQGFAEPFCVNAPVLAGSRKGFNRRLFVLPLEIQW